MKLKKLSASYGRLTGDTLELEGGLNIIEAPNESGKSTWCAFIRAILYGVDTSAHDKAGQLSDKTKYRPWSGAPMEGSAELTAGGRDITLQRTSTARYPMRGLTAVYADSGESVSGLTAKNAGELLTGVPEAVFERSAFIGQSSMRVTQTPELEKRISALVSTGEESTSYSEAVSRLGAWLRRRKYRQQGAIPALEAEISAADAALNEMERMTGEIASASEEAERETARVEALRRELRAHEQKRSSDAARRIDEAGASAREAADKLEALRNRLEATGSPTRESLAAIRGELASYYAAGALCETESIHAASAEKSRDAALNAAKSSPLYGKKLADIREAVRLAKGGAGFYLITAALIIIAAAAAIAAITVDGTLRYAAAAALVISGGILMFRAVRFIRRRQVLNGLMDDAGAGSPEELLQMADTSEELTAALAAAEERLNTARRNADGAKKLRAEAESRFTERAAVLRPAADDVSGAKAALAAAEELLGEAERAEAAAKAAAEVYNAAAGGKPREAREIDADAPTMELAEAEAQLKDAEARLRRLTERRDIALGRKAAIGDPMVIGSARAAAAERLSEQRAQYAALELAAEELAAANEELSTRFSPVLTKRASELMSALTGGRYVKAVFDSGFGASLSQADEPVSRSALSVSEGTVDQLYLALRLAIVELTLPGGDPCPIILDDALSRFDDERMGLALELLVKTAENRQVLLFTCQKREADYLAGRDGVNIIRLK